MKITAFNPLIVTKDAKAATELFEALGFEHAHKKTGINDEDITSFDMKHPGGFRVDVAQVDQMPQDMTAIRMNVRDFDEAFKFLSEHGFKNAQGEKVTDTGSSKATLMVSPSGFAISLAEHIRKDEDK
jgi:glutaminase